MALGKSEQQGYIKQETYSSGQRRDRETLCYSLFVFSQILNSVVSSSKTKLATLHLRLVFLQLSRLLLLLRQQCSVFLAARAALLDATESYEQEEDGEETDGASDDADFGALWEGGPAVAHAGGLLDFLKDFGFAAAVITKLVGVLLNVGRMG